MDGTGRDLAGEISYRCAAVPYAMAGERRRERELGEGAARARRGTTEQNRTAYGLTYHARNDRVCYCRL